MALFEQICSPPALLAAFERVKENEGCFGVDRVSIEEFAVDRVERVAVLSRALFEGRYRPRPLWKVGIPKDNGTTRWLSIPTVTDRVVQTSAAMALDPLLDPHFEDTSFAYRKERSVKKALRRLMELRDKGYTWVVDADITSFFDEIDHQTLLAMLRQYVSDERVVELVGKWLDADVFFEGRKERLTKGVPQGSPVSPLLSNLYLDSLDEALQKDKFKHIRFADDFVILCKDRPDAEEALELTDEVLKRLKLRLNEKKTRICSFDHGFRFLGVAFIKSMVFKPLYEDQDEEEAFKELAKLPLPPLPEPPAEEATDQTPTVEPVSSPEPVADTVMAEAFQKAFQEAGRPQLQPEPPPETPSAETLEEEPTAFHDPLLRTLYLMEQGIVLAKEDERFRIIRDKEVIKEVPALKVDQILIFGNIQVTTQAMKFCLESAIPIILLSATGSYFGSIESFKRAHVTLHRDQFGMADMPEASLAVAKAIVRGKVHNSRTILHRYGKKRKELSLGGQIAGLEDMLRKIATAQDHEELMGYEGAASVHHFAGLRLLLGDNWGFYRRQKQPPPDPVNSLLSYGYTLLFYNAYAMAHMHGLHPYVGFLHGIRDGHPALISDMIEEFRASVVDTVVLNLLLKGRIKRDDFQAPGSPAEPCLLKGEARKVFIRAFEAKMNSAITHPATGYKVDYRRCMDLQVQALRRVIEGKAERYEPFLIR